MAFLRFAAAAVIVAACSSPASDGALGVAEERVVYGAPSTSAQDFVLLIYDSNVGFECTGTLVAPGLVLTARHCVSRVTSGDAIVCDHDGKAKRGGDLGDDFPVQELSVYAGATRSQPFPPPVARGAKIVHDGASNLCGHDLALLAIAPPIENIAPAKLALDAAPSQGEEVTVVGWGASDKQNITRARAQKSGVHLLAVGPATVRGSFVPERTFALGESICHGDSGAPAIVEPGGAVLGVASFGTSGATSSGGDSVAGCVDADVLNTFTSVAAYRDLITAALR